MYHRMGLYSIQKKQYNKRPTFAYHSYPYGTAYLYFEDLSPAQRYWVIGAAVGSKDANLGVASSVGSPDQIDSEWHVADVKHGTFDASPDVTASCAEPGAAASAADSNSCGHISLYGQQKGLPMSHRMGVYKKLGVRHAGRPTYRFRSHKYGVAYLYYENLTPSEEYWVVGAKIGSVDANLGVADEALSADKVSVGGRARCRQLASAAAAWRHTRRAFLLARPGADARLPAYLPACRPVSRRRSPRPGTWPT
jgi:hypothetical protein